MDNQSEEIKKLTRENLSVGIKTLIRYLGQYKREIVVLSVMGILSAIGNGVVPYIAGRFLDSISSSVVVDVAGFVLNLYVALLIAWAIIQTTTYILDWRITIMSEYLSNLIWLDYISKGFGYLLTLPSSFHKQNKVGEIGNKINMAGNSLETIAGRIVIDLAPQILSIIIALGIAFWIQPLLGTFLVAGLVIYIFALVRKVKPLGKVYKEYWGTIHESWGDAYDVVGNAFAIKQATAEEHEREKLSKKMKSAVPLWMKLTNIWGSLNLYQRFTILGTQLLIFGFSIYYIHQGAMTLGELLALNSYAAMIFGPFVTIARNWQTIHNGVVNLQETEEILSLPPENYHPENAVAKTFDGEITFEKVSFAHEGNKQTLSDITFTAKPGEVIALVGESGVGKSTLIELISGYHFPTTGTVKIDGHDIKVVDLVSLRSQIAIVPQEVVLFNGTIKTNIKYGNFTATDEEIEAAAKKAHAYEFIQKFPNKWDQLVGERGMKLSVGQKQRIAIARAILRSPRILILDEPTSALDAGSEKAITESLEELMKGKTTFIVAHRLSTVRRADKILVFKGGSIIESGTHEELLKIADGEYRRLYDLQIGLHA